MVPNLLIVEQLPAAPNELADLCYIVLLLAAQVVACFVNVVEFVGLLVKVKQTEKY